MPTRTGACALIALLSLTVGRAALEAASPDEPKGYVQPALVLTVQPAGIANHRVFPPISGTAVGVAAVGGAFVGRTLAVESEAVVGQPVTTPQHFSYNWSEQFIGENRDVFLGANVRWAPGAARHLELVGGGGIAFSTFAERSIIRTDGVFPPHTITPLDDRVETARQLVLSGGVATPLPINRRIALVPAFTVRWVRRSSDGLGAYSGVGSYVYQVGCGVRFKIP